MSKYKTTIYVPEIDGLRAIAVLSVFAYHLNLAAITGGFVGVDIFFVISGYLISGIIFSEIDHEIFSFVRFYERRIRRITPALIGTVFATSLIFFFIFSPSEFATFRNSIESTILSVSNFYFYSTVDYFHNIDDIPLLHTWSLSVEEQFYLIFPGVIALYGMFVRGHRLPLLVGLALGSYALSVYLTLFNAPAAFYFPLSRWWELMAGSILAILDIKRLVSPWTMRIFSWMGLLGILASMVFLTDLMPFPGYVAVAPVVATCAAIAGAGGRSIPNRILSTTPARWLGRISYSLYLVHWPLITVLGCFLPMDNIRIKSLTVGLGILLAWCSWRFVEAPFRRPSPTINYRPYVALGLASVSMILLGVGESFAVDMFWRGHPIAEHYQSYVRYDNIATMRIGSCFLTSRFDDITIFDESHCLKIDEKKNNVLLLGDSHSAALVYGLSNVFPDINFLQASASGCQPIVNSVGSERCTKLIGYILNDWLVLHKEHLDGIILTGRWSRKDLPGVRKTIDLISRASIKVIVIGPSPEFFAPLPRLLAYFSLINRPLLVQKFLHKDRLSVDQAFRRDQVVSPHYVSVADAMCHGGGANENCDVLAGNVPIFFDRDHFTGEGSIYVVRRMANQLEDRF